METMVEHLVSDGNGRAVPRTSLTHLAIGTMVTTDLDAARRMYVDFFGLECVVYAPDRMMLRDRRAKYQMEHGERDFFVIDVREVSEVANRQANLNHWGFTVGAPAEVDRIRQLAKVDPEKFRLSRIAPITRMHDAYGFYFSDVDSNWWEIEYRGQKTNDYYFSMGHWNAVKPDQPLLIDPEQPLADIPATVVGPEAFLTHGTTDVADADVSRAFYEEVLGLRSVRHVQPAQYTAGGGQFAFVGVAMGARNAKQTPENRWVILVEPSDELERIHACAATSRDRFNLVQVTEISASEEGHRSFMICTADHNWFEVSTRPRASIVAIFEHPPETVQGRPA